MQTIKIRNLDSTEDNTITDNSYLALALNENDVKRGSEDPNDLNSRITVKTTISQLKNAILPAVGSSPPLSENEEGGIDVGIGEVILDENGDALVPQPPVVIKQGGKDQIKITDDGISLKENVIIDKTLSVTGPTTFNNTTTFNRDVFFNELTNDPSPTEGKIYRKSDGLYFNGSKLLTEGEGGKWVDGDSSGDIVYNAGNVGINNTGPAYKLDIAAPGADAKGIRVHTNNGTADSLMLIGGGGTTDVKFKVDGLGSTTIGSTLAINSSSNPANYPYMQFENVDETSADGTNLGAIFFKGQQPDGSLETGASIRAKGAGDAADTNNNLPAELIFQTNPGGTGGLVDRMLIDKDGKVVIGASLGVGTTPQEKFHVNGTIMLDDTPAPTTKTNKLYSVASVLYWGGNRILTGGSGSTGSGGIAIADISGLETALQNKLDKPAAGSEPTFVDSDINLKTNISPIKSPIKSLENIRGVNFEWKEESNKSGEDQGLIAQEVEKIIPSAVKKGEDGYLKVDYTKLVPFLLEAVKDLSERVKELEKN